MGVTLGRRDEEGGGTDPRACAACGAAARRVSARYCSTCGRDLGEDYFPTDSLRASYRFERAAASDVGGATARPPARSAAPAREALGPRPATAARASRREVFMAAKDTNGAATTALAFVTYALVPYVGILFCPGALLAGGFGLLRSYRAPHVGGRRASALGLLLGLLVFCAQLLLWWILYKVPEWSGAAGF